MDFLYAVLKNDKEVVAVFSSEEYAQDFIGYQQTISDDEFEIFPANF